MRDAAGPSYPAARGRLAPMTTQRQPAPRRIIRLVWNRTFRCRGCG